MNGNFLNMRLLHAELIIFTVYSVSGGENMVNVNFTNFAYWKFLIKEAEFQKSKISETSEVRIKDGP